MASGTARRALRSTITAGSIAVLLASAPNAHADDPATSQEPSPLPAPSIEPVVAPAGAGFYPTATYRYDHVPPRPVDALGPRECDDDDPRTHRDPRCHEVQADGSTSMNSVPLVVVGGALTVLGALGIGGGVALAGYESGPSTAQTSLGCRAGTSGVRCDPSIDTSGAVDVLATVGGVGLAVVGGAAALTGVTLVVVGALPEDDEPAPPSVQLSVAPTRVVLGATF